MSRRVLVVLAIGLSLSVAAGCSTIRTRMLMNDGNKLFKAQKYELALEKYQKILAIDPMSWPANYQIAMSYIALYHPGSTLKIDAEYADKGSAAFEKLLNMKAPDMDTAEKVRNYYIALLRSSGKDEKAIAYFQGLIKNDPKNTTLLSQLAEIFAKKGDFPNALLYYEKRAEADPGNKEAWYTIGVVCWERSYRMNKVISEQERVDAVDKGFKSLEKATAIDPEYTEALAYVGLLWREKASILAGQMKNEEAGEALSKADETMKKRLDILNKQRQAAAAAAAAGAPKPGK